MTMFVILYNKIKPVRRRGGGRRCGDRRGFRPPLILKFREKNFKKNFEKKSILKQVMVC
jgi:hypothetical protein